jgi:hypothetical protein
MNNPLPCVAAEPPIMQVPVKVLFGIGVVKPVRERVHWRGPPDSSEISRKALDLVCKSGAIYLSTSKRSTFAASIVLKTPSF